MMSTASDGRLARALMLTLLLLAVVLDRATAGTGDLALIVDHDLYPPEFSDGVIRRVAAAGLTVHFRESFPLLTTADLARYRMIVVESDSGVIGSDIQLEPAEATALVPYVSGGGLLVLAIPQDPDAWHHLGRLNELLSALGSGIAIRPGIADDDAGPSRYLSVMFPQCSFLATESFASRGVDRRLVLDRATILSVDPPGLVLARTSATAYARVGLGRAALEEMKPPKDGFPLVAMARCGAGYVLVIPRFSLNIGGFNSRVGTGPLTHLDWVPSSERFVQNILDEMVRLSKAEARAPGLGKGPDQPTARGERDPSPRPSPPANVPVTIIPAGEIFGRPRGDRDQRAHRAAYRATIRRDLYAPYLDHGMRAAWGDIDRDDDWLKALADGFKSSGFNYIWGVGWPERFVSSRYTEQQRAKLRRSWETFARELDGSPVGWSIGVNFPGDGFDRARYERCRGVRGQVLDIPSPLDLRYWYEVMIPALEEVARFGLDHPSVKGATIDFEMYGHDPFKIYPQAIGFEDVSFAAFLRAARGHLDEATHREASALAREGRYAWLRDRGLLPTFFLLLELESEKLGRLIRRRIRAIDPDFIFGAYQAALPDTWFYRGLVRGLSTPEMPMPWMSFQVISAPDVDRFWSDGRCILNATALMLGTFPIREYPGAMSAGRRHHDGYWINRYNWLVDDAMGKKGLEIPDGTREQAWRALQEGNRRIDEEERANARIDRSKSP